MKQAVAQWALLLFLSPFLVVGIITALVLIGVWVGADLIRQLAERIDG